MVNGPFFSPSSRKLSCQTYYLQIDIASIIHEKRIYTPFQANTASLNEYGPRDTALNPEAGKPNLKSTAKTSSSTSSSSSSAPSSVTSKLSAVRRDPIKQEFQLTKMNKDTSSTAALGPQADIKPSVSIIPLAGNDLLSATAASTATGSSSSSSSSAAAKKSAMSSGSGGK